MVNENKTLYYLNLKIVGVWCVVTKIIQIYSERRRKKKKTKTMFFVCEGNFSFFLQFDMRQDDTSMNKTK